MKATLPACVLDIRCLLDATQPLKSQLYQGITYENDVSLLPWESQFLWHSSTHSYLPRHRNHNCIEQRRKRDHTSSPFAHITYMHRHTCYVNDDEYEVVLVSYKSIQYKCIWHSLLGQHESGGLRCEHGGWQVRIVVAAFVLIIGTKNMEYDTHLCVTVTLSYEMKCDSPVGRAESVDRKREDWAD
jgi:hypothetical protein